VAQAFTAYSFLDVKASIVGPGGAFSIGSDSGAAEGGITIEMVEDKDTMVIGADGSPMHSLHAGQGGRVTIRLLKVSAVNFLLSALYDFQSASSATWGLNTIVISDISRGDVVTCMQCAFSRQPNNTWAKDGNVLEWPFTAGRVFELLGAGTTVVG
jgi:Protein of unknown function (DUF3277)